MNPPNNPPAFPACNEANVNGTTGMTLRDWFAGQALAGLMKKDPWAVSERHAITAYNIADAMLSARSVRSETDV